MNRSSKLVIVAAMILMGLFAVGCGASSDDGDGDVAGDGGGDSDTLNLYNWSERVC
jgi:hypothetical protein